MVGFIQVTESQRFNSLVFVDSFNNQLPTKMKEISQTSMASKHVLKKPWPLIAGGLINAISDQ